MRAFKDTSIMEGVREFRTDNGEDVRVMDEGGRLGIYVSNGSGYVRQASVEKKKGDTPRKIWRRYYGF